MAKCLLPAPDKFSEGCLLKSQNRRAPTINTSSWQARMLRDFSKAFRGIFTPCVKTHLTDVITCQRRSHLSSCRRTSRRISDSNLLYKHKCLTNTHASTGVKQVSKFADAFEAAIFINTESIEAHVPNQTLILVCG